MAKGYFLPQQQDEIRSDIPFPFNIRFRFNDFRVTYKPPVKKDTVEWANATHTRVLAPVVSVDPTEKTADVSASAACKPFFNTSFPAIGGGHQENQAPLGDLSEAPESDQTGVPAGESPVLESTPLQPFDFNIQFQTSTKSLPPLPDGFTEMAGETPWFSCNKQTSVATPDSATENNADYVIHAKFDAMEASGGLVETVYTSSNPHFAAKKTDVQSSHDEETFPLEVMPIEVTDFPLVEYSLDFPDIHREKVADSPPCTGGNGEAKETVLPMRPAPPRDFPPLSEEITDPDSLF